MVSGYLVGIYHFVSQKHLDKYLDEFAFRYNTRKIGEGMRFNAMLSNTVHRLTYDTLTNG